MRDQIIGKGGITAEVIADSIAHEVRLTTLQLCYPRFIHSEFMTHRMFSRNASSSRAIPIEKMNQNIAEHPAGPVEWGKNQSGMQARTVLASHDEGVAETVWNQATEDAIKHSKELLSLEVHKQIANRLTEPFQFIKVVVTATEWDNFFALRLHRDAQPEIQELAQVMHRAMQESHPRQLMVGDWHLPYVSEYDYDGNPSYYDDPAEAIKCSVARCARVSYLNHDKSDPDLDKDIDLHNLLLGAKHMSPFEHVATPMKHPFLCEGVVNDEGNVVLLKDEGTTHWGVDMQSWSGNFRGWVQYRNML